MAQPAPAQVALDEISVIGAGGGPAVPGPAGTAGERADGPVAGFTAKRSATGTKTDTALIDTPQSISVVTADQIRATAAQNPSEALRYTAGVQVERFGGDPRFDWVKVRGFDVPEYLDGLQLPKGTYAWSRYEIYGVERIEVLKGPAAVLYGQSPPGGLVNFVSKKPLDVPYREVLVQGGSFGRLTGAFDVTGPVDPEKTVLYRVVGLGRLSDTIVDYVNDDRAFIAPSVTFRPDAATQLTVLGYYIKDDSKSLQFLPSQGTLTPNPNGRIRRSVFLGEPGYDAFRREQFGIGYQFEHRFDEAATFKQNLRYSGVNVDLPVVRGFGFPTNAAGVVTDFRNVTRRAVRFDDNVNAFTMDNQFVLNAVTGPLAHTFLFGLDVRTFDIGFATRNALTTSLDVFAPVYRGFQPLPPITSRIRQNFEQIGAYAQDQIRFDRWVLLLSGRHDTVTSTTVQQVGNTRVDQTDRGLTYRAGLLYEFESGVSPYVSYATLFQPATGTGYNGIVPPTALGAGSTPFRPTTGDQIEGGLKYQPPGTASLFTLAGFSIDQQNVLVPTTFGFQSQVGGVRAEGFEAEAKVTAFEGFDVAAAYSYLDARITRTGTGPTAPRIGARIPVTPYNQAALFATYSFPPGPLFGLTVGGGVRFFGDHFGDLANTIPIPSYTLFDATIRYDLVRLNPAWAGATFALNATNLADKVYVATCDTRASCYYGNPRTVLATLSYRW
ncbi:TonB-dependent siderophore receptor [Methylobacterium sp. NEAU 140]|uniref:TonB-dependent siderophore receptor n=1 Tax=Methylobacterium sp. NEAU 140 TaxID=3064945 RepID=UPI0027376C92|nr:TonB-dependent siderophore receptor [Methylobacterium sp. NEAU 140]MDP4027129.1 TonB-dependent siderophore receptor [Methylobacterium sp. NEAU 140]